MRHQIDQQTTKEIQRTQRLLSIGQTIAILIFGFALGIAFGQVLAYLTCR